MGPIYSKFEVSSFNNSRDTYRKSQNSKSRSNVLFPTPFDLILHFLVSVPRGLCLPHLKFLASSITEIRRGSQNFKTRSRDPFTTPFDLILHFSIMVPVFNLSVKSDANIFINDRYMAILPLR